MDPEHGTSRGGHWEQGGTPCRAIDAPTGSLWGHRRGHQWSVVVEVLEICTCMYVATQLKFYT